MIDYRRIGQAFKLGVVFARGRSLANDERWITYHPNGKENPGRKALIDEDGNILKGGGPFGGMNLKDIPKKAAEIKEQRAKARTEKAGGAAGAGTTKEVVGGKLWTNMSQRIDAERSRASEDLRKSFRLRRQMNAASSPEEKAKLAKEHADLQESLKKRRADIAALEKEFDEKFPQKIEPPAYVNGYGEAMDPNKTQSRTTTTWERSQKRRKAKFDRYWNGSRGSRGE